MRDKVLSVKTPETAGVEHHSEIFQSIPSFLVSIDVPEKDHGQKYALGNLMVGGGLGLGQVLLPGQVILVNKSGASLFCNEATGLVSQLSLSLLLSSPSFQNKFCGHAAQGPFPPEDSQTLYSMCPLCHLWGNQVAETILIILDNFYINVDENLFHVCS